MFQTKKKNVQLPSVELPSLKPEATDQTSAADEFGERTVQLRCQCCNSKTGQVELLTKYVVVLTVWNLWGSEWWVLVSDFGLGLSHLPCVVQTFGPFSPNKSVGGREPKTSKQNLLWPIEVVLFKNELNTSHVYLESMVWIARTSRLIKYVWQN